MSALSVGLQLRVRCLVVAFYTLSIALLWYVKPHSCRSCVFTWWGPSCGRNFPRKPLQAPKVMAYLRTNYGSLVPDANCLQERRPPGSGSQKYSGTFAVA